MKSQMIKSFTEMIEIVKKRKDSDKNFTKNYWYFSMDFINLGWTKINQYWYFYNLLTNLGILEGDEALIDSFSEDNYIINKRILILTKEKEFDSWILDHFLNSRNLDPDLLKSIWKTLRCPDSRHKNFLKSCDEVLKDFSKFYLHLNLTFWTV